MDIKYGHNFRNVLQNFFNHPQINLLITGSLLLISAYISIIAVLGQNLLAPLAYVTDSSFSANAINEFVWSTVSLFFLLVISLAAGKAAHLINIPPLFGSLIVGIFLQNMPHLSTVFFLNAQWESTIRRLALVNIIIRWGMSVNAEFLKKHPALPLFLGIVTALCESAAIAVSAIFIFDMTVPMSILMSFILATASGAVSQPAIVYLQNENLGTDKSIPTLISTIACFDTIFCLTAFSLGAAVTFTDGPMFPTLVRAVGEILVCAICGLIVGWVLWWFPRKGESYTNMSRSLLIAFISTGAMIGLFSIDSGFAGICGVLCLCAVSTSQWRISNDGSVYSVEKSFTNLWNLLCSPLLFILVGMKMDFHMMTWTMVWISLALIALGWAARMVSTLILTSCSGFKFREQFVIAVGLLPKGTVQGALGPFFAATAAGFSQYEQDAYFMLVACIFSIMVTAPLGRMFLQFIGPYLLRKNFVQTVHIAPEDTYMHTHKIDDGLDSVITFKQFKSLHTTTADSNLNGHHQYARY